MAPRRRVRRRARARRSDTGFLLGAPRPDQTWGPNVWVELAGHAVEDPELTRDLYGAAAERWVDEGATGTTPSSLRTTGSLVDAWFHVGFGMQHVHAMRELTDEPGHRIPERPGGTGRGTRPRRALVELAPMLADHQARSPVFGAVPVDDPDEIRRSSARSWPSPTSSTS